MGERRVLRSAELRRADRQSAVLHARRTLHCQDPVMAHRLDQIRQDRAKREESMREMLPIIRIEAPPVRTYVPRERGKSIHAYVARRSYRKGGRYKTWSRK